MWKHHEALSKISKMLIAIGYQFGNRVKQKVNSPFFTDDRNKANEVYKELIKKGYKVVYQSENSVILTRRYAVEYLYGKHDYLYARVKISKTNGRYKYQFDIDKVPSR